MLLRKFPIGHSAVTALKLISQVSTVNVCQQKIVRKFPWLFKGLGTLEGEYKIVLRKYARPNTLKSLPLKGKVEVEFKCMKTLEVIHKVDVPTDWCTGMVVVPKNNSMVCICVDLTQLNKTVYCARHILLIGLVEQTLNSPDTSS